MVVEAAAKLLGPGGSLWRFRQILDGFLAWLNGIS